MYKGILPGTAKLETTRKFCQRGDQLNFDSFLSIFVVDEGRDNLNTTTSGHIRPASECHLNGIRWRADYGQTLNYGLVAL